MMDNKVWECEFATVVFKGNVPSETKTKKCKVYKDKNGQYVKHNYGKWYIKEMEVVDDFELFPTFEAK